MTEAAPRMEVAYINVGDIKPYPNNPRDNERAVEAVANSILEFGFRVPVIIDHDREIVAGHTRVLAVQSLMEQYPDRAEEFAQVPCLIVDDLTEDQIKAFRLVDNKTSELALWDFDMLAGEMTALADAGVEMTTFGWAQEELDCLEQVVADDDLADVSGDDTEDDAPEGDKPSLRGHQNYMYSKDGTSVRVAVGEFGFYVLREDYDAWAEALRKGTEFDLEKMIEQVAERLGLKDAKVKRDALLHIGGEDDNDDDKPVEKKK